MKRAVDPSLYDKKYYFSDCGGYVEYLSSKGDKMDPRLKELVERMPKIKKNMKILDVGCGRGELCYWAASKGAKVNGIDYSKDAIKIASEGIGRKNINIKHLCEFKVMDIKNLKYPNNYFDGIFFIEVLEHLFPWEKDMAFKEFKRVLKKNGFLVIHTEPNKYFNDIGYKYWAYPVGSLLIKINNIFGGKYPEMTHPNKLRKESHKVMHVGEETYFSFRKLLLKHNFQGDIISTNVIWNKPIFSWKDTFFNLIAFVNPVSKYFPFNMILGQDYFVLLKKK
jgi:ubiquinone/menaquinone biosynthesis C-methylase UbiE